MLEKLAAEADGKWILAKVDVDANPQLAAALQVQSIPMVVAVIGGQLVDGFLGAMPEAQVRQWLGQVLAVAEKICLARRAAPTSRPTRPKGQAGSGAYDAADQLPPAFEQARSAMARGRHGRRGPRLRRAAGRVARRPDGQGRAGPGQPDLPGRPYDQARARRKAAERPEDVQAQIRVADVDLASGRVEDAFDRLLGVIRRTSGEDRKQARAHLVGLFDILPPRDQRVGKARSALSALLF